MDFFDLVSNLPLNSLLTAYQPLFSETLRTADRCTVQPAQAALLAGVAAVLVMGETIVTVRGRGF